MTQFEPNKMFAFKSTQRPISIEATVGFQPSGGGTKLSLNIQGQTGNLLPLEEQIVARMAK